MALSQKRKKQIVFRIVRDKNNSDKFIFAKIKRTDLSPDNQYRADFIAKIKENESMIHPVRLSENGDTFFVNEQKVYDAVLKIFRGPNEIPRVGPYKRNSEL